jgi:hypothetical protein
MTRTASFAKPALAGRYRLIGVTALLALSGVPSAVAMAGPAYTVKVKVPASVVQSHLFTVTAHGLSSNLSHLTVFLTDGSCASTAHRAKVLGGLEIISANVVHHYSKSITRKAKFVGMHAACAYLTSVSPTAAITYARTKAIYTIHVAS